MSKRVVHKYAGSIWDSWVTNGHLCHMKAGLTNATGPCCEIRWSKVTCKLCLAKRKA